MTKAMTIAAADEQGDEDDPHRHAALEGSLQALSLVLDGHGYSALAISTRLSLNVGASRSVVSRCGVVACGLWPPA